MIDFSSTRITSLSIHRVGNDTNGESLVLSENELNVGDTFLHDLLLRYFLSSFTGEELYQFDFSNGDIALNPIYHYSKKFFAGETNLLDCSIDAAKHLFEKAIHPQIKAGDFFSVHFEGVRLQGEYMPAVGYFKCENKQSFLKLQLGLSGYQIDFEDGINIDKLDKGCLILNSEEEKGYKVCISDKSNRSTDTQYWKDDFLKVKACSDSFHQTKAFLNLTKEFITNKLPDEFEVNKTDQIDLLNRSVDFFKKNEQFDLKDFSREVIQQPELIESFHQYRNFFQTENNLEIPEDFDISNSAVKKQSRIFKSILKLDKNFHIYIHGNKDMIERGTDSDGRKFYKIYYQEEH